MGILLVSKTDPSIGHKSEQLLYVRPSDQKKEREKEREREGGREEQM